MDVSDHRSSVAPDVEVDLSPIYAAIDQWKWLLDEQYVGPRPGYDELEHDHLCNLSPKYQAGRSQEEVARLLTYGCDRGCLKTWREKQRQLAIETAERESLPWDFGRL